jgi:hypothetical protein
MIGKAAFSIHKRGNQMEFIEGYQRFTFDDQFWTVFKYDHEAAYQDRIQKLPETKAVDFVGMHHKNVYFIEAKDFRGYRIENKNRLLDEALPVEIGQKVRDTIAGIIGAYRTTSDPGRWEMLAKTLTARNSMVRVVVWLEYDMPAQNPARQKVRASVESNVFKKKLFWLTPRVFVTNQANHNLPNATVVNLPRP